MKTFFLNILIKLRLIKPKHYIVRQYGMLLGSYSAYNETHALDVMSKGFGHKSFDEFCRVLGLAPEAHKLEVAK